VIIEAVSALFFVQSNKTRQLMTEFFDKLRSDRKLDESLQLMANIPSDVISSRLRAVVALHFAEVKLDHESIKYLLADDEKKRTTERPHRGAPRDKIVDGAHTSTAPIEQERSPQDGVRQPPRVLQTDKAFAQIEIAASADMASPPDSDPGATVVGPRPLKSTGVG
jgi:hypothetical protein